MAKADSDLKTDFDTVIIGAGISGINAGYRIQEDRAIAGAPSILNYLRTVEARHGIDKHIKFHHEVLSMDWRSDEQKWRIEVLVNKTEKKTFWARFIVMGTGYYNEALQTKIPGLENFKGTVVHPQFWPTDLDYANKRVLIIGSGATAVTMLPAMHENGASHVTIIWSNAAQATSSSSPASNPSTPFIRKWFPSSISHRLIRFRVLIQSFLFFYYCRLFPEQATRLLHSNTEKELPPNIRVNPHFIPAYRPWEQHMCITPDGDFFKALRSGKADVATGHIKTVTATGLELESGQVLDADIIITATGLKVQMCGNATLSVDGQQVSIGDKFVWRGSMLQDIPNLAFIFGYTNASWTLGSDATARLFVRLLKSMKKRGVTSVVPSIADPNSVKGVEMLNLSSSYIKAAVKKQFPKAGDVAPWKPRRTYFVDSWFASFGDIATGLVFNRVPT